MPTQCKISSHPIAYVETFRADGSSQRSGFVSCTRRGQMVSTSTCQHCPRMLKVSAEPDGDVLQCVSTAESEAAHPALPMTLQRLPVSAIMTRNVVCVRPDLTLDAAMALFLESGLRSAPVVDGDGKLIGFVSECEITLDVQSRGQTGLPRTVADVMLPYALTLPESASVTQAAAVLAFEGQQRLAVVSPSGAVIGILSASDVLYWLARSDGHLLPRPRAR